MRERVSDDSDPAEGAEPARRAAEKTVEAGKNGKGGRRRGEWHLPGRRRESSQDDLAGTGRGALISTEGHL
jgi:hypothetical protein